MCYLCIVYQIALKCVCGFPEFRRLSEVHQITQAHIDVLLIVKQVLFYVYF